MTKKLDNCQKCLGEKGGVPGNENVIDGLILCDYCSAEERHDFVRERHEHLRKFAEQNV